MHVIFYFSRHVDGLDRHDRPPTFVYDDDGQDNGGDDLSRTVKVAAAQTFELHCKAKGHPKPKVREVGHRIFLRLLY